MAWVKRRDRYDCIKLGDILYLYLSLYLHLVTLSPNTLKLIRLERDQAIVFLLYAAF